MFLSRKHVHGWNAKTRTRYIKLLENIFLEIPMLSNVMEVWESDLLDVQNISKFNDNYNYLLTVTDVFSKFLHVVPLKSKTGPTVTSAFQSIFNDKKYSKPHKQRPLTADI